MGIKNNDGIEYLTAKLIPVEFYALSMLSKGSPFYYIDDKYEYFTTPLAKFDPAFLTYNPQNDEIFKDIIDLAMDKNVLDENFLTRLSM